ncbi:fructose-bisphosphate aldolase class II [Weissella uvarum]|uniref:class II fructose-bisphosphate aldolase n=1 Tax=Weissella uvarum TaxID=1479233 RepID=UPI00195FC829|nr:ketose-bisphosphate aldolase [Weissella uvarum]MBM7616971.1 fructose-bisphosphate aldolase class II [Weissella uvarum]MCM0595274.1 ketose-bisphosphate aldolase [Weissella uvarum]
MITNGVEMLQKARAEHYAVPAFNVNNLEWAKAIILACEKMQSPVIMQVTGGAAKYMGNFKVAHDLIADMYEALGATVPVSIHLDHGTYAEVDEALDADFTSIMFDGSSLPLEENVAKTSEVAKKVHIHNKQLEGEVGTIGGEEDGVIADGELASLEDTLKVAQAGVDSLAVGIGNIHGPYPDNWKGLNLAHLKSISDMLYDKLGYDLPLVLHGGSGIPDDQVQAAIKLGISKVNVNTEGQLAFHKAIRNFVQADKDLEGKNYDPRRFLETGTEAIQAMCEDRITVFGSNGKA